VFPLDYAMSLTDTAQAIGVSKGWACQLRRQFMRGRKVGDTAVVVKTVVAKSLMLKRFFGVDRFDFLVPTD
jgi:hypothetical protein